MRTYDSEMLYKMFSSTINQMRYSHVISIDKEEEK